MHLNDTLRSSHAAKWEMTWQKGRVDVQGNVTLASTVYSALYYIIAAMPLEPDMTWPFVGLSPADLAHNVSLYITVIKFITLRKTKDVLILKQSALPIHVQASCV